MILLYSIKKVHRVVDIIALALPNYRLKNTFIKNKIPIKTTNPTKIL